MAAECSGVLSFFPGGRCACSVDYDVIMYGYSLSRLPLVGYMDGRYV